MITINRLTLVIFTFTFLPNLFSQQSNWVKQITGSNFVESLGIRSDSSGNVYSFGSFTDTVDVDPDTTNLSLIGSALRDTYITKSDSLGNLIWAVQLKFANPYSFEIDASGNVYIAGTFRTSTDFDPGPGILQINTGIEPDLFVLKLNNQGQLVWVKQLEVSGSAAILCLTLDRSGNIFVAGTLTGHFCSIDLSPGTGVVSIDKTGGNVFLLKLDPTGNYVWHKQYGHGAQSFKVRTITTDFKENVYLGGDFEGNFDFNLGQDTFLLTSTSWFSNGFITQLDKNGSFGWAKHYPPASGGTTLESIKTDIFSNVYITGEFNSVLDLDRDTSKYSLSPAGPSVYLSKLNVDGDLVWAKMITGINNISGHPHDPLIAVDDYGTLYLGGGFIHTVDFDPGPDVFTISTNGREALFLTKLDASGNFRWAKKMQGFFDRKFLLDLHIGPNSNLYASGSFRDSIEFSEIDGQSILKSTGDYNAFNLRLMQCQTVGPTLTVTSCEEYHWVADSLIYNKGGTYSAAVRDSQTCDSVILLNLVIAPIDTSVIFQGSTLTAIDSSASYQWLSCDSSYIIIPGEQGQSFMPKSNGKYAVIITKHGCTDTSACVSISNIGIIESNLLKGLTVYPNPTNESFTIDFGDYVNDVVITVTNALGQKLSSQRHLYANKAELSIKGKPGVYLIQIWLGGKAASQLKIIKQP